MTNKKTLIVIDGNAIIHRAYHALPPLYTKGNELINAVYGFTSMLLNVMSKVEADYIICTFDLAGPTFRNKLYSEYKANRKEMEDGLAGQLKKIREIVNAFNIPVYEKEGYEADDVIGSIVSSIQKNNSELNMVIVSGDRDILQLLDDNVKVILPGRSFSDMVIYDRVKFKEKYGFESKYLIDFKALYGDKSDNIPGVYKIGEKTATGLVEQYGALENIYENLTAIKPNLANRLLEDRDKAYLSKDLATIYRDIDLNIDLEKANIKNFDEFEVKKKFLEFEFKSLLSKIPKSEKKLENVRMGEENLVEIMNEPQIDANYELIASWEGFSKFLDILSSNKLFSFDTETTSLDPFTGEIVGISIGFFGKRAYYIPLKNDVFEELEESESLVENAKYEIWRTFLSILASEKYKKVAHNAKFDIHALNGSAIKLNGLIFDTMIASYLLNLAQNDLKGLALNYEGVEMKTFMELTDKMKIDIRDVDKYEVAKYSGADADLTFRLYERLLKMLDEEGNEKVKSLFYEVEMPLIHVLCAMEKKGVRLDVSYMDKLSDYVNEKIDFYRGQIYSIVGHEFNINSPKQLSDVIFNELNLPKGRKTKTGYSTDERYFLSIGNGIHPIVPVIRKYREVVKLKSTYISVLPTLVDKNSRIHTSYNQAIASSGRLSSSNPNLQNIPVKTELGNRIRRAFIADENSVFLSFDYSQIELRIMAHLSKDANLIAAFNRGIDVHAQTARLIFNKEEITDKERSFAKTINFGIIYGISSFGLSQQLGISRGDAQKMIDKYFSVYQGVYKYIQDQRKNLFEKGYVESLFGRKRVFRGLERLSGAEQNAMLREAINMPLQATNADAIKMAMNKAQDLIEEKYKNASMILQVHDELIFEYRCNELLEEIQGGDLASIIHTDLELAEFCKEIKKIMEEVIVLDVPIRVDGAIGKNWGELKELSIV